MALEINDFTWQSLREYIERRITGAGDTLQLIKKDARVSDFAQSIASLEHQLEMLHWCLPLVNEMQNREDMQAICPIMSLEIIRLRCRHKHDVQVHSSDFAWISPLADRRYMLKRVNPLEHEKEWSFEGDLIQIVEKVEKLVKEICVKENH